MNDDTERTDSPEPGQPLILPVLPVRDLVVFPHMVVPLIVVRDRSVRALTEVPKNRLAVIDRLIMTERVEKYLLLRSILL